jgi:uncharacterized protein (TIGR03435 family)
MRLLLGDAFSVPLDQISASDWIMDQDFRFNISANIPAGATKEQAHEMLLNFLKERFLLTYHTEKKDFDLYTLVVAKGGPKLREAAPAEGTPPEAPRAGTLAQLAPRDRDGFPQLPPGIRRASGVTDHGVTRQSFRMYTMQDFLGMLRGSLGSSRLADKTGLIGKYDFTLEFSKAGLPGPMLRDIYGSLPPVPVENEDPSGGPTLFSALEKQLGLKLEKSKTPLDVMMVDHMDKQPIEN